MPEARDARSDGLSGEWLSLEELSEIPFFQGTKRAFKIKLNANLSPVKDQKEPGIKAVVRREYQKGDVICKAGDYGSTAFLLLEGRAVVGLPSRTAPTFIAGRTEASLNRLLGMFRRRAAVPTAEPPGPSCVGEASAFATIACERPPLPAQLGPGDFFGIDTCINFYPREATVIAEERCVALEMLRSVLDSIREAGNAADTVDGSYRAEAIRRTLQLNPLFAGLTDEQFERAVAAAELLTADSASAREGRFFAQGEPADTVFVVRAGTVKLTQARPGSEIVLAYLTRGALFGAECLQPARPLRRWVLRCVSHPDRFPPREVAGSLTLGRAPSCDVIFPREEGTISGRHCRVEEREGDLYVVDLGSTNFTYLNGERVNEAILVPGDRIEIVDYAFEIAVAPARSADAAVVRGASAVALDDFEVIALRADVLLQLAAENERLAQSLGAAARETRPVVRSAAEQARLERIVELNLYNSQNTLLIDLERCTRCDECVRACADAHGGVARFTRDGPRFGKYLVTLACRSCTDPRCMIGCPVGSIRRLESLEIRIEDWCIGCQKCASQCPFGNINMLELAPPAGEEPPQLRATVCDLCAGYDGPNCVYACPHDAAIRVQPAAFLTSGDLR